MWFSNILKKIFIFFIKIYNFFSPFFYKGVCRFYPTCSNYAINAIKEHGALIGLYKSILRICKCHPLGKHGYDPVKKGKE
tara:strand:- start:275 stop:514 length:240 start_codon:yes stop_codon:yes gene_type:complete